MTEPKYGEPWCAFIKGNTIGIEYGTVPTGKGPCIVNWPGFDSCDLPLPKQKRNARRIVLCVNACSGLTDDQVEDERDRRTQIVALKAALDSLTSENAALKAEVQRLERVALKCHDLELDAVEKLSRLLTRRSAIEAAARGYRMFFNDVLEVACEAHEDLPPEEIIDYAHKAGLLQRLIYDEANEAMVEFAMASNMIDIQDGHTFWYVKGQEPKLDALAALLASPDATEKGEANEG